MSGLKNKPSLKIYRWEAQEKKVVNIISVQGNVTDYTPPGMGKLRRLAMPVADKDVEQLEFSSR